MYACSLRFYIHENHRHQQQLAYKWLLAQAAELGVTNGSAFRAMAGFRGGDEYHQDDLMEAVMDMTVMVELLLDVGLAEQLLDRVRQANLPVLFARTQVELEMLAGPRTDEPLLHQRPALLAANA